MSVVANVAINVDAANAIQQLNRVKTAATDVQGGFNSAAVGAKGLGVALQSAIAPLLTITAALTAVKAGLDVAFERGAAEQRLKNITSSAGEFNAAMALAADTSQKFGLTQTESTKALADVYSRLKGVGFGLQETSQIYQGFNAIAQQSGLAGEEAAGAFFQLSQALGKGKLNGDEFVIVAERMPQLLDAIAQTTGKSRGELTQMAQDGQITSQVLYQALSGAANAAGGLTDKLTQQQQVSNNLRQATDQLFYSIGSVFAPAVISGMQGLSYVFAEINNKMPEIIAGAKALLGPFIAMGQAVLPAVKAAFDGLLGNIQGVLQTVTFFTAFVGIFKAVTLATQAWTLATQGLATAKKVAAVAAAALQAIMNPASLAKIALAIGGAAAASYALGKAMDEAAKNTGQTNTESKNLTGEVDKLLKQYSSLPPVIDDAKESAKKLKEEQQAITKAIQEATKAADDDAKALDAIASQRQTMTEAYYQAEKQINGVLIEQAQRQLDNAKNQAQRTKAAQSIYDLTVKQAQLEYQATAAQIAAEVEKADLAFLAAQQKVKEVEAIVRLAAAQGKANEEHYKALKAIKEAAELADIQAATVAEVAVQQERAARAVFDGSVQAAKAAYQQNIVAKATGTAASASGTFASNMERAATAAQKVSSATSGAVVGMKSATAVGAQYDFGPAGQNAAFKAAYEAALNRLQMDQTRMFVSVADAERKYAELNQRFFEQATSYNKQFWENSRKNAEESWFKGGGGALPGMSYANASASGMQQYGIGTGTSMAAPQVNITTGPVTQMGGTNYVTMSDLQQATSTAARQGANLALSQLQNSPSVRRSIGVAR